MQIHALILASLSFLTACAGQVETRLVVPEVSDDLRSPVPISDRRAETVRVLAIVATEHLVAAQEANAKITAIDEILTCAEAQAAEKPC